MHPDVIALVALESEDSAVEALEARLDTLETRVAHQDRMIEDLNSTITDQWKLIEALTRQVIIQAEAMFREWPVAA